MRNQVYQWRAEFRDGLPDEAGTEIVDFVPVDVATSVTLEPPATGEVATDRVIEIGLAGDRLYGRTGAGLP